MVRHDVPADKTLIGVCGGEQAAGVDALDLVLCGPGDKMAVVDCNDILEGVRGVERGILRTDPLFARLEHPRGDRAQALHPHHALPVDVVHEQSLARD